MAALADQMKSVIRGAHECRKMIRLKDREDLSKLFNSHLKLYFDFFAYKDEIVAVRDHHHPFDDRCSKSDYVVNLVILLLKGIIRSLLIESVGEPVEKTQFLRKTIKEVLGADADFDSNEMSLAQQVQLFERKAMLSATFRANFVEYLNRVICTKFRGQFKSVERFLESQWRDTSLVESALNIIKHVVLHQGIRSNVYFATANKKRAILNHFEIFQILPDVIVILSIDNSYIWISNAIFDNGKNRDIEIKSWEERDSYSTSNSESKPTVKDPWLHLRSGRQKPFDSASDKQHLSIKKPRAGMSPALNFERIHKKPSDTSNSQTSVYPRSSGEAGINRYVPQKPNSNAELQELNIYEARGVQEQLSSRTEGSMHSPSKSLSQSAPFKDENHSAHSDFERPTHTQQLRDPFLHSRSSSRNTFPIPASGSSTSVRAKPAEAGTDYHQFLLARREARVDSRPPTGLQLKETPQRSIYAPPLTDHIDGRAGHPEYHSVSSGSQGFLDNIIGGMNRGTGESSDGDRQLTFRGSGSSNTFPSTHPFLNEQQDKPMHMLRELSKHSQKPLVAQPAQGTSRNLHPLQQHTTGSYTDRYLNNLEAKRPTSQTHLAGEQRHKPSAVNEGRIFDRTDTPRQHTTDCFDANHIDGLAPHSSTVKNLQLAPKPAAHNQPYFAEQRFTFATPSPQPNAFGRRDTTQHLTHIQRPASPARVFVQQASNPSSKIDIFGQPPASLTHQQQPQTIQYRPAPQTTAHSPVLVNAGQLYQPSYHKQLKPLIDNNSELDFSLGSIVNAFDRNTDLIAERRRTDRGESLGRRDPAAADPFTPINIYAPSQTHFGQASDRAYY